MKKHKLTYEEVIKTGLLVNMTGLTERDFEKFSESFTKEHNEYTKIYTFKGEPRTRELKCRSNSRSNSRSTFSCEKDMLLFITTYLRNYQTQSQILIGVQFGLDQEQVSSWVHFLSNILFKTLNATDCLPTMRDEFKKLLEWHGKVGHGKVFKYATTPVPQSSLSETKTAAYLQRLKDNGRWNDNYDYSQVRYEKRKQVIVFDENGLKHEMLERSLLSGNKLSIRSAVDKTAYFLQQLKDKGYWNNKYDYSKVRYSGDRGQISIGDENGFEHVATAMAFLNGTKLTTKTAVDKINYKARNGAVKVKAKNINGKREKTGGRKKKTTETFIEQAKVVHGDDYIYDRTIYNGAHELSLIFCPSDEYGYLHGDFKCSPANHLAGKGCPKCVGKNKTTKEFIVHSNKVHECKYTYDKTIYSGAKEKCIITCPAHGDFPCTPDNHLHGKGCPECDEITTEIFIERSKKVYGDDLFDYSEVVYKKMISEVGITCLLHNEKFSQTPLSHLDGHVICKKCNEVAVVKKFISRGKEIHNNFYDYSLLKNITIPSNRDTVPIICPIHGVFEQNSVNHLTRKYGCPSCSKSKGETSIEKHLVLNGLVKGTDFIPQKTFDDCVRIKKLKFDFYLAAQNTIIEYDGEQHFMSIDWWGGEDKFKKIIELDEFKNEYCARKGIKMVRIKYTEFDLIESIISNILHGEYASAGRHD